MADATLPLASWTDGPGVSLPLRKGPRPRATTTNPHSQLDGFPSRLLTGELIARCGHWAGVVQGPSRRAPPGTVGFHLPPNGGDVDPQAVLIDREFAHVHPSADGSLHLVLPEPLRRAAIAAGWAEPHPIAGSPTVSAGTVMVYGPRTGAELDLVFGLIGASWRNARD